MIVQQYIEAVCIQTKYVEQQVFKDNEMKQLAYSIFVSKYFFLLNNSNKFQSKQCLSVCLFFSLHPLSFHVHVLKTF